MHDPIPQYRLREWHRHLKRITENATCDPGDTRTANALRLARKDLREMERHILTKKDNGIPHDFHSSSGEETEERT